MTTRPTAGATRERELIEKLAMIRWVLLGAVIPWESADPEVQERYHAKARAFLAKGAA